MMSEIHTHTDALVLPQIALYPTELALSYRRISVSTQYVLFQYIKTRHAR